MDGSSGMQFAPGGPLPNSKPDTPLPKPKPAPKERTPEQKLAAAIWPAQDTCSSSTI